uniref:hypothetical protein n=1 Tax=Gelidibacter sp. TaxID=2018083 RepID=UPI004049D30A
MSTIELKQRITDYLENADERVLKIVNSVFENYYHQEQVAFHPDGSPMSRKQYKEALDIAENQVNEGDFISVDDLE